MAKVVNIDRGFEKSNDTYLPKADSIDSMCKKKCD